MKSEENIMKWYRIVQSGLKVQVPKDWAVLHNIENGDKVCIEENGDKLILNFEKS